MKYKLLDLFCGLGGWTEAFLAEGYDCVGVDIERHSYLLPESDNFDNGRKGTKPIPKRGWTQGCAVSLGLEGKPAKPRTIKAEYPAQLILQDVRTLHGRQFKDFTAIVASPPCQEFSYMAMPWSRAKQIERALRGEDSFPDGYTGSRTIEELTELFNACFRIQREACEAAGRYIPMVVENVRGACKWVGRAEWHHGSFYLWGDVPALMPVISSGLKGIPHKPAGHWTNPDENRVKQRGISGIRNNGKGDKWFQDGTATYGSKSNARKMASALIARIPYPLALHIARCFKAFS